MVAQLGENIKWIPPNLAKNFKKFRRRNSRRVTELRRIPETFRKIRMKLAAF
jgi:hypothetical protein